MKNRFIWTADISVSANMNSIEDQMLTLSTLDIFEFKTLYFDYADPVYDVWTSSKTNHNRQSMKTKTPVPICPKFKMGDDLREDCIVTTPNGNIVHYSKFKAMTIDELEANKKKKISNPLTQLMACKRRI